MDAEMKRAGYITAKNKDNNNSNGLINKYINIIRDKIYRKDQEQSETKRSIRKIIRGLEFLLLFFGIPIVIYSGSLLDHPSVILLPILAGMVLYFILKKDFKLRWLIHLNVPRQVIWKNIGLVLLTGALLTGAVYLFKPDSLFNLPRKNPEVWLLLFFFYPLFSAYSQEVVYRTFLFTRYKMLFKNSYFLILISGITFGFAHIIYYHPLSMLMTLVAGVYLAWIYKKTKSVLFVAILHALLGNLVFTIGLGEYFWLNMESHL